MFGNGLGAYLRLLRVLAVVTTALACSVYLISVIFTLMASEDARDDPLTGVQNVARVSIAPLRVLYDPATDAASWKYGNTTRAQGLDKRTVLTVISSLDCFAMATILFAIVRFRRHLKRDIAHEKRDTVTLASYSLAVHGLPREPMQAEELQTHLETALPQLKGTIAKVAVARAYGIYLERLAAEGALEEALESLDAKAAATGKDLSKPRAKLSAKLDKLSAKVGELNEAELPTACAFVTFHTAAARDVALAAYPCGPVYAAFAFLQPQPLRFRGSFHIRMTAGEEPSDLLWENLHYHAISREVRKAAAGWFVFALLLGTIGITVVSKQYQKESPPDIQCAAMEADNMLQCDNLWNLSATTHNTDAARLTVARLGQGVQSESCDAYIGATTGLWLASVDWTTWTNQSTYNNGAGMVAILPNASASVVACAARVCQGCYCSDLGLAAWESNQGDTNGFCYDFWHSYLAAWALKGMSILFVVLSNLVFTASIPFFTAFEKLHTRGQQQASTALKMFLSTFFNAYVVTLLVYADITDLSNFPLIFKGAYNDFTPSWFAAIGSSLFLTAFTQAVQPPLVSALSAKVKEMLKGFSVASQYTQRDLNALFLGPEWSLATRAAQVLNASWLALVLCGSIPGAGFLLAFVFLLSYVSDKYFLCRIARTPPRYEAGVVLTLCSLLVWGVWVHFATTAWAMGNGSMPFYSVHIAGSQASAYSARISDSKSQFNVGQRLAKVQVLIQGLPFLFLSLWLFLIKPYGGLLYRIVLSLVPDEKPEPAGAAAAAAADAEAPAEAAKAPEGVEASATVDLGESTQRGLAAGGKSRSMVQELKAALQSELCYQISFQEAISTGKLAGATEYDIRSQPQYATALHALTHSASGVSHKGEGSVSGKRSEKLEVEAKAD